MSMIDPGSFRDPSGRVIRQGSRILRTVYEPGRAAFEAARDAGVHQAAIDAKFLLPMIEVDSDALRDLEPQSAHVLEHPVLPFVSYPYEWTFTQLKTAAIHHLDFQLFLLERGFTLSDATAYNVQFIGTKPVFIDHLSIIPYVEGGLWAGHRQFCMQFLNPLVLWAKRGIAPHAWFRGNLEGIAPEDLSPLLPLTSKFSFTVAAHIVAQGRVQRRAVDTARHATKKPSLGKNALIGMIQGLRSYIGRLTLKGGATVWSDYANNNSYGTAEREGKQAFVAEMVATVKPGQLFDIGCNSGDYSQLALDSGAAGVIGFDFDFGALEQAYARFDRANAPVLPLWLDAANPSPDQGWAGSERMSFGRRANADAVLALAVIHHLAIGRNVPLDMAVDWLMSLAPTGVIEFPSKSDPMVQTLLATREDIFPDYTEEAFLAAVAARGAILRQDHLGDAGRLMIWYDRTR